MRALAPQQISAFRLQAHHLEGPLTAGDLVDVVRASCGIQAQQMNPARLSVRARTLRLEPRDVDDALWRDHSLVRLWAMRQCVHLLPAVDLPLYVAALGSSLSRINRGWMERYGMDEERSSALMDIVLEALEGGPLTREELGREVEGSARPEDIRWVTHSWGGILTRGCYKGELVFGPNKGQNTTFMRRDGALKEWDPPEEGEAKGILVRRYLHAYGPARVQDFVAWSATTVREFKPVWEALGDDVVDLEHGGRTVQMLCDDYEMASSLEPRGPVVNLLGHFDTYLLGHKERAQVVAEPRRKEVFRKAGWVSQTVIVDGRVAGTWKGERRAAGTRILVTPFKRLSMRVKKGIDREATDLSRFWDTEVEVEYER